MLWTQQTNKTEMHNNFAKEFLLGQLYLKGGSKAKQSKQYLARVGCKSSTNKLSLDQGDIS